MFARLLSVMALLLLVSGLSAQGKEMLRITETRFVPSEAKPGDEVRLEVGLEVLPGYHAYGTLDENGTVPELTLSDAQGLVAKGKLIWPEGDPHEKYGLMNYWVMGKATLAQVYVVPKGASGELTVKGKVGGQICNEGMCYQVDGIDFTAKLNVLGAAQPAAQPATGEPGVDEPAVGDPDPGMPGMGQGFGEPDFGQQLIAELKLEPATARPGEVVTIRVNVIPPLGKHVYGGKQEGPQRTTLSLIGDGGTKPLGYSQLPHGEPHGSDFWLSDPFDIVQRVYVPEHMPAGELNFLARLDYMVCDETMCDPPAHKEFKVSLPIELGEVRKEHAPSAEDIEALKQLGTVSELKGEGEGSPGEGAAGTGSSDVEGGAGGGSNSPADKPLLAFILLAIGWGLFALVMPCTYPMIPITISFFTKQASARGGSVLPLSLMYGLGIVLIFILIGLIVGPAIIPFATHYVTNILIGVVFVLFALSLFGVFTLQPPKFLMNSASKASMKGGYVGVFLMGATLVVTSFTCTAPFVGSLLAFGAQGGDLGRVALGMGVFGLTMAIPFVILSLVPGRISALPKSGNWMNTLKVVLGFIELAAALKFFSNADLALHLNLLPRELFLLLWFVILGTAALYLLGIINLKGEAKEGIGASRMAWGVAIMTFAFYCLFGAQGNKLDRIMAAIVPNYQAPRTYASAGPAETKKYPTAYEHQGKHLVFVDDYDTARQAAINERKLLMVNFTGVT
jgi:thiol:disulfide interchange protein